MQEWIPALDGMPERLSRGARVADVGCGYGTATLLLADAYPSSTFVGYDSHPASVAVAREAAAQAGVGGRVGFDVADATEISGPYDLIAFFDAWHDTADPLGAAAAARRALADDGSVLLVEPLAYDRLEDNCSPLGRLFYGASALICTPCSVSGGGPGLGAQLGPGPHPGHLPPGRLRPLPTRRRNTAQRRLRDPLLTAHRAVSVTGGAGGSDRPDADQRPRYREMATSTASSSSRWRK